MELLNETQLAEVELTYKSRVKACDRPKVKTSADAHELIRRVYNVDTIEHHEQFYVFLMNRANHVLGFSRVSQGGTSGTVVDTRIILQLALKTNASAMMISHNHPSGQLRPSEQDILITRKLKEAAKLFDISLLDHLIMTADSYYSFADNGQM
jgi:DNA repair protein RadC